MHAKIEDDLKMHSHYIEDLFISKNGINDDIEMLRARTHEIKERIGIMACTLNYQDENMMKCLENQKEIAKANQEMKDIIDQMNCKTYTRFYLIEFVKEIINSPKNWLLIIGLVITIELTIGFSDLLKHFLRLG